MDVSLHLAFGASRLQRGFSLVCHLLAAATPWASGLPGTAAGALSLGVALSAWIHWRRGAQPPLVQLLHRDGAWTLVGPGQQVWRGKVLASTCVGRWLILLHFRLGDGRFLALPVWRDSLAADDYRRLRVVLRWCLR